MKRTDANASNRSLRGNRKVDRVALLEKLVELDSITAAAKAVGISYKGAWEAIEALNNLSDAPLVERTVGGTGGGGTRLTRHGEKVLSLLRDLDTDFQGFLAAMGGGRRRFDRFYNYFQLMRRWNMKTSARNRLCGVVSRCVEGAVNGEVIIDLPGGKSIAGIITNDSMQSLGLKQGVRACALVKASHIILAVNS